MTTYIQIIRGIDGKEMVVMPRAEYDRLTVLAEARQHIDDDARDAADAKKMIARVKSGKESVVSGTSVRNMIVDDVHAVRAWRKERKMTAAILAHAAGISRAYLTQIETGKRNGTLDVMKKLAKALNVTVDDIA